MEEGDRTTHTPGPWEVRQDDLVYAAGRRLIADCESCPPALRPNAPIEEDMANARLITAAPELLEACKYVVSYHREHDSGEGELFGLDFVTTCIAAIAKAEGG